MSFVVRFDEYTPELRPLLGGKNASLGEMIAAGLPVPPGFAVTTDAFATLMADRALAGDVKELLARSDPSDPVSVEPVSAAVRERIEGATLDAGVALAVEEGYARLCAGHERRGATWGVEHLPVAVRSSATAEDQPDASFAGEHDSFLWVQGAGEVARHLLRCWSSLYTARAICYRAAMGYGQAVLAMSVGVQQMVRPKAAGVAFTLNPTNGDRSQVCIEASWGLGEAVVSGEVTPDNFLVDKVLGEITRRTISPKTLEYRVDGSGVKRVAIAGGRATEPCLTDEEVRAVAAMARRAERHYGFPLDVEWAVDSELSAPDNVILLQARPETVWSRKKRPSLAVPGASILDGIVSTLVAPIHTRKP